MNEYVQQNLRDVGIDLEIVPIEWNALRLILDSRVLCDQ